MILFSTTYFPPISWLALLYQNQQARIDLWETYPKQSYRNRCRIATSNGVMDLSIPVKKPNGNASKTKEISFDEKQDWRKQHWKSIKNAYQSTPFFIHYEDAIQEVLFKEYEHLWQLNHAIILLLCEEIDIDSQISYTSDFIEEPKEPDIRFLIHPKKEQLTDFPPYYQVFDDKLGFIPDLSSLDLLFNLGPESLIYLDQLPRISVLKQ